MLDVKKTDGRTRDWLPRTDFQRWIKPILDANSASGSGPSTYQALYEELRNRGVDIRENTVYKFVRGDPAKFPSNQRPEYDTTLAIGEILGDVFGALRSAGYRIASESATVAHGAQTRVIDSETLEILDAFEGLPPGPVRDSARKHIEMLRNLSATTYMERTDIIGKRPIEDDEIIRVPAEDE